MLQHSYEISIRICRKMTKTRSRYGKSDKNVFEYTQTERDFLNYACLCGIIFLLIIKELLCKEVSSIVKMEDTSLQYVWTAGKLSDTIKYNICAKPTGGCA